MDIPPPKGLFWTQWKPGDSVPALPSRGDRFRKPVSPGCPGEAEAACGHPSWVWACEDLRESPAPPAPRPPPPRCPLAGGGCLVASSPRTKAGLGKHVSAQRTPAAVLRLGPGFPVHGLCLEMITRAARGRHLGASMPLCPTAHPPAPREMTEPGAPSLASAPLALMDWVVWGPGGELMDLLLGNHREQPL